MLIRFIINNFMSFKEETEFNMLTGKSYKTHTEHVNETNSGVKLIKSAAIYGANGSGKSNLVKAIAFLKNLLENEIEEETLIMPSSKKFRLDESFKEKAT